MVDVPYIDISGKFSTRTLYKWKTTPTRWYASTVSTVYSRLWKVSRKRHGIKFCNKVYRKLLQAAALYVFLRKDSLIDRVLGILRKKDSKGLNGVLLSFARNLDENERFVVNQVCYQTNWFTSRSERPRDKSSVRFKKWLSEPILEPLEEDLEEGFRSIARWKETPIQSGMKYGSYSPDAFASDSEWPLF
jgi:hypothetical protein